MTKVAVSFIDNTAPFRAELARLACGEPSPVLFSFD